MGVGGLHDGNGRCENVSYVLSYTDLSYRPTLRCLVGVGGLHDGNGRCENVSYVLSYTDLSCRPTLRCLVGVGGCVSDGADSDDSWPHVQWDDSNDDDYDRVPTRPTNNRPNVLQHSDVGGRRAYTHSPVHLTTIDEHVSQLYERLFSNLEPRRSE